MFRPFRNLRLGAQDMKSKKKRKSMRWRRGNEKLLEDLSFYAPVAVLLEMLNNETLDPNAEDEDSGISILLFSCSNPEPESTELVKALLEKGADVNVPDRKGLTPLHYAAASNHPERVDLCMRFGANPNVKDHTDRTALHVACANHHELADGSTKPSNSFRHYVNHQKECIDLLVSASPELLNQKDGQGRTPLFDCLKAVGAGVSWDLMGLMLERGADPTVVDQNDENLAHFILRQADCHRSQMPRRVLFETQCLFRLLVNLEPQLLSQRDSKGPNGQTPFMIVCAWGNLDLIFYFLKEHCAIQEMLQA